MRAILASASALRAAAATTYDLVVMDLTDPVGPSVELYSPATTALSPLPISETTLVDEVPGTAIPAAPEESSSEFGVRIEGATYTSDYEGKPVIVVNFAFTNNSDAAASFIFSLNAQAFQNGIELNDIAIGVDGIDSSLSMADLQPGVTIVVQEPFLLRDGSNVKVEVREQFSFTDDILASQEFSTGQ